MSSLTREQILSQRVPFTTVNIPELNGTVNIKALSGAEREVWARNCRERSKPNGDFDDTNFMVSFLVLVLVDDQGNRLFSENELETLNKLDARALERMFREAQNFNGFGKAAEQEIAKNS